MTDESSEALTQYRLEMIENALRSISETLAKLATLEQKHIETREAIERAFDAIADKDKRLRDIETEMPMLKMVKGWVITGVIGIIGLLATAIFGLFHISLH